MKLPDLQKIKSAFIKTTNRQQAGLACLASVIRFYGGNAEMQKLLKNSGAAVNSVTLLGLCKAARMEGFEANGYKGNIDFLKEQENPVILHIEKESGYEDFIVVYGWQNNKFIIGDPQWGIIEYREEELKAVWKSETLMLLEPGKSFESVKDKQNEQKEWLFELLKSQKKNLILNGLVGVLLAIVFVVIFLLAVNFIEQLVTVKSARDFGIKAVLLFLLFLAFIAFFWLKNSFANRGIKSFVLELNNHLTDSIFALSPNRSKLTGGIISSLSCAIQQFCKVVIKLTLGGTFLSLLFITTLVYVCFISVWAGVAILISSFALIWVIWLRSKKISQLSVLRYQTEIQKADNLANNFEFYKYILLSNSEKLFPLQPAMS